MEEKLDNDRTAVYLVRQIASDDQEIVKSIMREILDRLKATLERCGFENFGTFKD